MATEVVTRVLCDVCNRDELKRDGTRYVIMVNGKGTEFDACEEHAAPIADAIKLLEEFGRRPSGLPLAPRPSKTRGAWSSGINDPQDCAICGKTYKNTQSLNAHLRQEHGTTVAKLSGTASLTCGKCGRHFQTAAGLGSHRNMHGRQGAAR